MAVKPSQAITCEFVTSRFDTGAATNADSTPTGTFVREGTDDGTVSVTVTNIDAGRYKAAFTIPSGALAGNTVELSVAATVNSVAGKGIVWREQIDTKIVSDLHDSAYAGGAVASVTGDVGGKVLGGGASSITGVGAEVDVQTIKGQAVTATGTVDLDDLSADVDAIETRVTTALPSVAPQAAGGLITSALGSLDMDDLAADVDATETRVVLALPAVAPAASGGLPTVGTGAGQINPASGGVDVQTIKTQAVTATATVDLDDLSADVDAIETRVTTALPNAAPQAAGGLITSTAGSLDVDEMNTDIEAIQTVTDQFRFTVANQVDANALSGGGSGLTAQQTRDAMKLAPTAGAPAAGSIDDQLAEIEGETDGIAAIPTNPLLTTDSRLNNLDATISSRLATSGYTAPDNADIATILTDVGNLLTRLTATRAALMDNLVNLDAAISSRLATAGYTAPPSTAAIDAELSGVHGAGAWGPITGSGAFAITVTVTDGVSPIQGALVRLSRTGQSLIGQTDASGVASFSVDAATYTLSVTMLGYQYTPTTQVISASGNINVVMTLESIPLPPTSIQSTGFLYTYDAQGAIVSAVTITFEMISGPNGGSGQSFSDASFSATSDTSGLLTVELAKGATYIAKRSPGGPQATFNVPDLDTFELPVVLGSP